MTMRYKNTIWSIYVVLFILDVTQCEPLLLVANGKDISLVEAGPLSLRAGPVRNASLLVQGLDDAAAIDYLYDDGLIFWADVTNQKIQMTSIKDRELFTDTQCRQCRRMSDVITLGLESPDGLAVDWVTRKLYWTDSESDRIEVSDLDGGQRKVIVWQGLDQPRAVALDPKHGYLYWSDWGDEPSIKRVAMDGDPASVKVIVDSHIFWPTGLTIDYEEQRLYWADAKLKFIQSCDLNGSNPQTILNHSQVLKTPHALALYGDRLLWTDWNLASSIMSCNKHTGGDRNTVIHEIFEQPMDIHAYHKSRQPHVESACAQTDNGGCSDLCLLSPYPPYHTCACPTGVKLTSDGKTCEQGPQNFLLLARRQDIRLISLDTPDYTDTVLPLADLKHTIALDYDPVDRHIYWTDEKCQCIRRAYVNGSDQQVIASTEVQHPDGIAVDWIARNLYWTDTGTDRIEVMRLNGSNRKILISDDLDEPRAIVVDPVNGYMYWTDWGAKPRIERAALDGTSRQVVANHTPQSPLAWPNGLAIDYSTGWLYWGDAKTDRIEMCRLDGSGRKVLIAGTESENMPHIFGLALLGDYVYWTDWTDRSIERVHKRTGQGRDLVLTDRSDVMGLAAVDLHRYQGSNPCAVNNGGCSDLCLHRPVALGGTHCTCVMGKELQADNKTCIVLDAFLLFTEQKNIHMSSLDASNNDQVIPLRGVQNALVLDFVVDENRVYWADSKLMSISRAFMNGSALQPVVEFGLDNPEAMAVDWMARNLYWADKGTRRIEMARLDGSSRKVLIWNGVKHPRSIALDPANGLMYWIDWDTTPRIERAGLDGSNRTVLINQKGRMNGLTLDFSEGRIYWVDIDNDTIASAALDGTDIRNSVASKLNNPFSMTQFEDFIYWTDWGLQTIERANKSNGLNRSTVQDSLQSYVTDLLVFHESRQSGSNPCARDNGGCSHLCIAQNHSAFHCTCPSHFSLSGDSKHCLPPQSFVLIAQKDQMRRMLFDLDQSPDLILPIRNLKNVKAVTYDPMTDLVYWATATKGYIRRATANNDSQSETLNKRDTSSSEMELMDTNHAGTNDDDDTEVTLPFDLALDPYARMLYYSDERTNTITVINVSGAETRVIGTVISGENDRPRHIAIDPRQGVMFWTNHLDPDTIEVCDLDGTSRIKLIERDVGHPVALALDSQAFRLYWIDTLFKRIESVHYNGGDRTRLVERDMEFPMGLTVFGDHIYWIDKEQNFVKRADKRTGANDVIVQARLNDLRDILSAQAITEEERRAHPCGINNGNCTHLCIPEKTFARGGSASALGGHSASASVLHRCSCPEGLMMDTDKRTCKTRVTCGPAEFPCQNGGECFPLEWQCDGEKDCTDESDERGCQACDPATQFRCNNGHCLPITQRCNGEKNCPGGADEEDCPPCDKKKQFECRADRTCISRTLLCNLHDDCSNGEDESGCENIYPDGVRPHNGNSGASYAVAIILSVVLVPVVLIVFLYCLCKRKREPPIVDVDIVMVTKPLTSQYDVTQVSHKSGTTCITATSEDDNCHSSASPLYDRNHLTGASSSNGSTVHYPHETLNPPPSPVTSHHTGDVFSVTSQSPTTTLRSSSAAITSTPYRTSGNNGGSANQPKSLRRHYHHYHHHHHHHSNGAVPTSQHHHHSNGGGTKSSSRHYHNHHHHSNKIPSSALPLNNTPCSTSVCEDSEPYHRPITSRAHAIAHARNCTPAQSARALKSTSSPAKYYPLSDSDEENYDSEGDMLGPPPPTPARSYYFSDEPLSSPPPSPSTERSFFCSKGKVPPPPSPVAFSDT